MAYEEFLHLDELRLVLPWLREQKIGLPQLDAFLPLYEAAAQRGDLDTLRRDVLVQREAFIRRLLARTKGQVGLWWEEASPTTLRGLEPGLELVPTRRHGALLAWAYSPVPDQLAAWLDGLGPPD